MRRGTCVWLVAAFVVLCWSVAAGQVIMAPGPENTLSVTTTGSAQSPADWAEIALSVEGKGATAQEALAVCDESWRNLLGELATLQIPEGDIRSTPPEIGPNPLAQIMEAMPGDEEGEAAEHAVRRSVIVRLAQADPEALYEGICRIIDVAADAGATLKTPGPMQQVWAQGSLVTFGANDPKPLRAQAISSGLAAAKEVAEVVAASTGRKLGAIAGVQVSELGPQGYLGMIGAMLFEPRAGQALCHVSLTVTYHLE